MKAKKKQAKKPKQKAQKQILTAVRCCPLKRMDYET